MDVNKVLGLSNLIPLSLVADPPEPTPRDFVSPPPCLIVGGTVPCRWRGSILPLDTPLLVVVATFGLPPLKKRNAQHVVLNYLRAK